MGVKTVIVKQIMPADGWWAVFICNGLPVMEKVACWVTTSDSMGDNYIVGVVYRNSVFLSPVDEIPNFKFYIYADDENKAYDKAVINIKEGVGV